MYGTGGMAGCSPPSDVGFGGGCQAGVQFYSDNLAKFELGGHQDGSPFAASEVDEAIVLDAGWELSAIHRAMTCWNREGAMP